MLGRDGTGQMRRGSMTGRCLGFCNRGNPIDKGADIGLNQGFGKGFNRRRFQGKGEANLTESLTQKELLKED